MQQDCLWDSKEQDWEWTAQLICFFVWDKTASGTARSKTESIHSISFPMLLLAVPEAVSSHTKIRSRSAVQSIFCVAPRCPRGKLVPYKSEENLFHPVLALLGRVPRCLWSQTLLLGSLRRGPGTAARCSPNLVYFGNFCIMIVLFEDFPHIWMFWGIKIDLFLLFWAKKMQLNIFFSFSSSLLSTSSRVAYLWMKALHSPWEWLPIVYNVPPSNTWGPDARHASYTCGK